MKDSNPKFVVAVVNAVAKVVEVNVDLLETVLSGLLSLVSCHKDASVHSSTAAALRHLLQIGLVHAGADDAGYLDEKEKKKKKRNRGGREEKPSVDRERLRRTRDHCVQVLRRALRLLFCEDGAISDAVARANLIWLAGEFYHEIEPLAKDMLRLLAASFVEETVMAKMQILTMAVKYSLRCPGDMDMESLMTYALEMSRYDVCTEVRDLARLMTAVCGLAAGDYSADNPGAAAGKASHVNPDALEDLANRSAKVLLAVKLPPAAVLSTAYSSSAAALWNRDDSASKQLFVMGSLSAVTGYSAPGYAVLPDWRTRPPDSGLREQGSNASSALSEDSKRSSGVIWDPMQQNGQRKVTDFYSEDDDSESSRRSDRAKPRFASNRSRSSRSSSDSGSEGSSSGSSSSARSSDSDESSASRQRPSGGSAVRRYASSSGSSSAYSSESDGSSSDSFIDRRGSKVSKTQRNSRASSGTNPARPEYEADNLGAAREETSVFRRQGVRRVTGAHAGSNSSSQKLSGLQSSLDEMFIGNAVAVSDAKVLSPLSGSDTFDLLGSATAPIQSSSQLKDYHYHSNTQQSGSAMPAGTDSDILAQILESFPNGPSEAESHKQVQGRPSVSVSAALQVHPGVAPSNSVGFVETMSQPKVVLQPELASGLYVALIFRHGVRPSTLHGVGSKSAIIKVKNCGQDYPIRYAFLKELYLTSIKLF